MKENSNSCSCSNKQDALQATMQAQAAEVEILAKQAEAQFALTPMGQTLKQFEVCQRMGQLFSQTTIVPDAYKGNMPNCAVAVDMALRMGMPPVMVMQNLYVVHGNPAWSSKFLIACVNGCGRFTPLQYERKEGVAEDDDEYGWRCVAYARGDVKRQQPLHGPWVTWKMVKAEGWATKNGSKWKTMPELMFHYRAAAFWQRTYAPELAMGIPTVEEAADVRRAEDVEYEDVTPARGAKPEPEEEAKPELTAGQVEAAVDALAAAVTKSEVKAVRDAHRAVYDADEAYREALLARYEEAND